LLSGRYHSAHTWLLSARTRAYTDLVQSVLHALPMEPRSCRFEHVGVTDGDQLLTKSSGCCCGVGDMDKIQVLKTCFCTIARSCDKICPSPPWGSLCVIVVRISVGRPIVGVIWGNLKLDHTIGANFWGASTSPKPRALISSSI
jgi:hypothetical protein